MIWFTRFRNWNIPHNRLSDWKPLNLFIEYSLNRANMYHEIDLLSSNIFPWEGEQISQCICTPFGSIKYAAILLPLKAFLYWSDKVLHIAWAQCSCRKFSFMGKFQLLDLYEYIWMYNIEMIVMGVINVDWNVSDGDLPGNDKRFLRMLRSFRDFSVKKELFKKKKRMKLMKRPHWLLLDLLPPVYYKFFLIDFPISSPNISSLNESRSGDLLTWKTCKS